MQLSVISNQYSVLRSCAFETLDQPRKHLFYLGNILVGLNVANWRNESQVASQKKEILHFACGAHCYVQEVPKLYPAASTASFSNVCGNRTAGSSELGGESESFIGRKGLTDLVDRKRQPMALLPDTQPSKILHLRFLELGFTDG